jgi:hypothetical protein
VTNVANNVIGFKQIRRESFILADASTLDSFQLGQNKARAEKGSRKKRASNQNRCRYLSLPRTLMLNNFPKARADVELFVIKFVADLKKSGEESATVDLLWKKDCLLQCQQQRCWRS